MATSVATPTETKVQTRWLNEKPTVTEGFTILEVTGTFPDPDIAGKQIEAGKYVQVPVTVEGISAYADKKELKDKNFSALTGINKLAYDALKLLARRDAIAEIQNELDGPAVVIEKAVKKLLVLMPGLTEDQARVIATAANEQASANKTTPATPTT